MYFIVTVQSLFLGNLKFWTWCDVILMCVTTWIQPGSNRLFSLNSLMAATMYWHNLKWLREPGNEVKMLARPPESRQSVWSSTAGYIAELESALHHHSFSQSFCLITWNTLLTPHYPNCKCLCNSSSMVHQTSIVCQQKGRIHRNVSFTFQNKSSFYVGIFWVLFKMKSCVVIVWDMLVKMFRCFVTTIVKPENASHTQISVLYYFLLAFFFFYIYTIQSVTLL